MSILIATVAWILLGLAGTYIGHKFIDEGKFDMTREEVVYLSMAGPVVFIGAIVILAAKVFKAKKEK